MRKFIVAAIFMCVPFTVHAACEDIPYGTQQHICFAFTTGDTSYCDRIDDNDMMLYCYVKLTNDKTYCRKMSERAKRKNCMQIVKKGKNNKRRK